MATIKIKFRTSSVKTKVSIQNWRLDKILP